MATESTNKLPRRDSAVSGINSPEDASQVARKFIRAVANFSSDDGYRKVAELVDRIPRLQAEMQEKEKASKLAGEAWERERTTHTAELRNTLHMFEERFAQFGKKEAGFEQRVAELEASLSERDRTIADSKEKETALKSTGRRMKEEWEGAKTKLKERESEIAQLKKQMQDDQAKAKKLSTALNTSQAETSALNNSLEQTKQRNTLLDENLKVVEAQLKEANSYHAQLTDVNSNDLAGEFTKIWVSIKILVRKYIGEDLPDSMLARPWNDLNKGAGFLVDKPLPQSNSDIAKELRVVKVLFILANAIDEYLLQPTYQSPDEDGSFRALLYSLACVEPKRERALRGMLLAALENEREDAEEQLASRVVEEVMRHKGVDDVVRPDLKDEFLSNLDDILCDVQDIWQKAQYSTQVLATSFEPTQATEFAWEVPNPSVDDAHQVPAYIDDDDDVVVLFPKLSRIDDGEKLIAAGTIVRKSVIYAFMREDRRHSKAAEPGPSRPRQRPGRALSISSNIRSGQGREAFLSHTTGSNGQSNA